MKRILVVYFSHSGHTAFVAQQVARRCRADLLAIKDGRSLRDGLAMNFQLRGYRVLDNLVFDRKKLKAYLRERDIGVLEIKKRGADITPEELRKQLDPKGKGAATLVVTRVGDAHRVLVCEPIRNWVET
mgnify:CR=1 FL=1